MKMKTLLIILTIGWTTVTMHAQEQNETQPSKDPRGRARIDAARAAYITERLGLTTEESERFWPVYREFAGKRLELRRDFATAKRQGTDEKELVNLRLEIKQKELDLEKDYSGKMMEVISAGKLMGLEPAEREFTRIIVRQIQQRKTDRRPHMREKHRESSPPRQRNN